MVHLIYDLVTFVDDIEDSDEDDTFKKAKLTHNPEPVRRSKRSTKSTATVIDLEDDSDAAKSDTEKQLVQCPVCKQEIGARAFHSTHLDECLEKNTKAEKSATEDNRINGHSTNYPAVRDSTYDEIMSKLDLNELAPGEDEPIKHQDETKKRDTERQEKEREKIKSPQEGDSIVILDIDDDDTAMTTTVFTTTEDNGEEELETRRKKAFDKPERPKPGLYLAQFSKDGTRTNTNSNTNNKNYSNNSKSNSSSNNRSNNNSKQSSSNNSYGSNNDDDDSDRRPPPRHNLTDSDTDDPHQPQQKRRKTSDTDTTTASAGSPPLPRSPKQQSIYDFTTSSSATNTENKPPRGTRFSLKRGAPSSSSSSSATTTSPNSVDTTTTTTSHDSPVLPTPNSNVDSPVQPTSPSREQQPETKFTLPANHTLITVPKEVKDSFGADIKENFANMKIRPLPKKEPTTNTTPDDTNTDVSLIYTHLAPHSFFFLTD